MDADLAVVGGGPAGLAAAATAAQYGLRVLLLDEQPDPGGSLSGALDEEVGPDGKPRWMIGRDRAAELTEAAVRAGVQILTGTSVWGIWPGWSVYVDRPGDNRIRARSLIVATGAKQRPVILPGWTLPGVMTPGAVQRLLHVHRVCPGKTAVVVGVDWLAVLTARHLALAGVNVRGIVLPPLNMPGAISPRAAIDQLAGFAGTGASLSLARAARCIRSNTGTILTPEQLPLDGIPLGQTRLLLLRAAVAILGAEEVTGVEIVELSPSGEQRGRPERWDVDTVVLSGGLSPLCELPQLIGCHVVYIPELGGTVPLHGSNYETTVPGVFVAGSIAGIVPAPVAIAQGRLAGTAAAAWLEALSPGRAGDLLAAARRAVMETRASAPSLLASSHAVDVSMNRLWCRALTSSRMAHGGEG